MRSDSSVRRNLLLTSLFDPENAELFDAAQSAHARSTAYDADKLSCGPTASKRCLSRCRCDHVARWSGARSAAQEGTACRSRRKDKSWLTSPAPRRQLAKGRKDE